MINESNLFEPDRCWLFLIDDQVFRSSIQSTRNHTKIEGNLMQQFKTKDLLVTFLPKAKPVDKQAATACLFRTVICRYPTIGCLHGTCIGVSVGCGNNCSLFGTCGYCSIIGTCGACSVLGTCGVCSIHGTIGCGILNSCGPGRSVCDPTIFCPGGSRDPFVIEHAEDLVALKAELQEALKGLDAIQKEGLPSVIDSKAEAETLERGLTEALDQVRSAKKNL